MSYRKMTLSEAKGDLGFYLWFCIELVLVAVSVFCLFQSKFDLAFLIFILIELREVNQNLKGK